MMSVRVSGSPISGQAQTSVSSPSTGSGVSHSPSPSRCGVLSSACGFGMDVASQDNEAPA
jgi:hypothetical protein